MPTKNQNPDNLYTPSWLHWLAIATVVCALPLLTLGAEVTTKQVGMVDQSPVRSPWYLLELSQDEDGWMNIAKVIEHSHRTLGWVVGILAIGLAIGLACFEHRRRLRWAGLAALLAVSLQGALGALRVYVGTASGPAAGSTVALIHGITAPLVFAFLVSVVIWTSRAWQRLAREKPMAMSADPSAGDSGAASTWRPAVILVVLMYVQIIFGAIMRHKEMPLGTRAHILLAFAVVVAAAWLGSRVLQTQPQGSLARRVLWVLWLLLAAQLMLGLETMFSKFDVRWGYNTGGRLEPLVQAPELVRSLHYLVGAATFAAAVVNALVARCQVAKTPRPMPVPRRHLEGAL